MKNHALTLISNKKLLLVPLISLVVFGLLVTYYSVFRIETVTINGAHSLQGVSQYVGKNIFFESTKDMESSLREVNPQLRTIRVEKKLPNEIYMYVELSYPVIILQIQDGYLELGETGVILSKSRDIQSENLPLVTTFQPRYFQNFKVGDIIESADVITAAIIADDLEKDSIAIISIDITNENMIVLNGEDHDFYVTSIKDAHVQSEEITYVYDRLKLKDEEFSAIDVRFDQPIVKY